MDYDSYADLSTQTIEVQSEVEEKACRFKIREAWTEWTSDCSFSYRSHTFSQRTRKCKITECPCRKDITQIRPCSSSDIQLSKNALCHVLLKNITSKDDIICADQEKLLHITYVT